MEWYYVLAIILWAMPAGFLVFAIAFVDGSFIKSLPAALLWPLWIPIALISELYNGWK
jgi:hypothetical protein